MVATTGFSKSQYEIMLHMVAIYRHYICKLCIRNKNVDFEKINAKIDEIEQIIKYSIKYD